MPQPATKSPPAPSSRRPGVAYSRVLLKLSGEAFCNPGGHGIDGDELAVISGEIKNALATGAKIAVVVGGGNMVRGAKMSKDVHIHQATADYMGMLATVINGLALKEGLRAAGIDSRVLTAIDIRAVAEPFVRGRAMRHLEKGRVVVLVAGTGNPFCTTDTCAALRAIELECDVILKATKVDGVYSADPRTNPDATRYDSITFEESLSRKLGVMDMTALAMCQEHKLPVLVFDFKVPGNIRRVIAGDPTIGTLVHT